MNLHNILGVLRGKSYNPDSVVPEVKELLFLTAKRMGRRYSEDNVKEFASEFVLEIYRVKPLKTVGSRYVFALARRVIYSYDKTASKSLTKVEDLASVPKGPCVDVSAALYSIRTLPFPDFFSDYLSELLEESAPGELASLMSSNSFLSQLLAAIIFGKIGCLEELMEIVPGVLGLKEEAPVAGLGFTEVEARLLFRSVIGKTGRKLVVLLYILMREYLFLAIASFLPASLLGISKKQLRRLREDARIYIIIENGASFSEVAQGFKLRKRDVYARYKKAERLLDKNGRIFTKWLQQIRRERERNRAS